MSRSMMVLAGVMMGCGGGGEEGGGVDPEPTDVPTDLDGDGFDAPEDCDDDDPAVHPAAVEVCDGVDNNCNAMVDADDPGLDPNSAEGIFYPDADGDGFGDGAGGVLLCEADAALVTDGTDCDDAAADIFPGNEDPCDLIDQDCDPGTVGRGVWFVGDDGTSEDVMASGEGGVFIEYTAEAAGTLYVCPGTWALGVHALSDIDITGIGGRDVVRLVGQTGMQRFGISVDTDNTVSISGLTIADFRNDFAGFGSALVCSAAADVTVDDVSFEGNASSYGGAAAALEQCVLTVTNSNFDGNLSSAYGGHLYVAGTATVTDSDFRNGQSEAGGALSTAALALDDPKLAATANVTCTGCTFEANRANLGGAVLVLSDANYTMVDGAFDGNTGLLGGALALTEVPERVGPGTSVASLTNVSFDNNLGQTGASVYAGPTDAPFTHDFEGTVQTVTCADDVGC